MKKIIARKSIKTKILGIVIFSILLITVSLGYLSFEFSKQRLVSLVSDSMKGVAATIAISIQPEDISFVLENSEEIKRKRIGGKAASAAGVEGEKLYEGLSGQNGKTDEAQNIYERYTNLLSRIKKLNKIESPINIYVLSDDRFRLVLTSDPVMLAGVPYTINAEAKEAIFTGLPQSTGIYQDKDGTWISAYAPILAASGQSPVRSVIEINYRIDLYIARLRSELGVIIFICILVSAGAASIAYRRVNNLVAAIESLDDIASDLEKAHYDKPVTLKSDDEIGHLAQTFETLRLSIKNKIEELRLTLVREKRAHLESIVALTNAMEMRDPYTKQHLFRVEKYAILIAKAMRLGRVEMQKLKYSCFLHDIGKIYIETELLSKDKLTFEDFEEIKKHSERGAKIIEGIQFLEGVKEAVLHHQEYYDGTGYPDGLKGKEIPLLARIILVADAFDAMTTTRPYRQKMGFEKALHEIEKNSGTQFDPEIVTAFLKYRNSIEKIAKKHFEYPSTEIS